MSKVKRIVVRDREAVEAVLYARKITDELTRTGARSGIELQAWRLAERVLSLVARGRLK